MVVVESEPTTLTLHAVRLLGFADAGRIARLFMQDVDETGERLLAFEALGWVRRCEFPGAAGWSLTELGRAEDERRLAVELDTADVRAVVSGVHRRFLPLNSRFQDAATRWQIRLAPSG